MPIGVGNFGRVSSTELSGSGIGDLDRDGVSDPLDIDDDGDLVLDNIDATPQGSAARVAQSEVGDFPVFARLQASSAGAYEPVNANAPGMNDARIEAALPSYGLLGVRGEESAELDCGGPQGGANPGLVYCTPGGTGRVNDENRPSDPYPECCDEDGNGFGSFTGIVGGSIFHGANSDQIKSGDVLIQRIARPDGSEEQLAATVQYVFGTNPALVSYDDGQGNSQTLDYSAPLDFEFPVEAGPSGDVIVELTFWRPQRRPIPPETDEWIEIGDLDYFIAALPEVGRGQFCPQDSLSSSDPSLVPQETFGDYTTGGGYGDLAEDRPASPDNVIGFQVNLTECLEAAGASSDPIWEFEFGAYSRTVTDEYFLPDLTSVKLRFVPT